MCSVLSLRFDMKANLNIVLNDILSNGICNVILNICTTSHTLFIFHTTGFNNGDFKLGELNYILLISKDLNKLTEIRMLKK